MKRSLILILIAAALTACKSSDSVSEVKNEPNNEVNNKPTRPDYICVDFEEDTRVEFNGEGKTVWSEGDQVVRFGTDIIDVWKYTGLTGEDTNRFDFAKELEILDDYDYEDTYYLLYSYDSFWEVTYTPDGPEVLLDIKATQNYEPNTYDHKSTIMLAESTNSDTFSLSNLMGYLHIPLVGDKSISTITVTGNNNEILNGKRWVAMSDPNITSWDNNTSTSTTLNCGSGIELSNSVTDIYITLVPTVFSKGLTLDFCLSDNSTYRIIFDDKMTIKRNHILHLEKIDVKEFEQSEYKQSISIHHSGDIVAFPILNDAYYIRWGDGNTNAINYYSEFCGSYVYNDGKASHTITIYSNNASEFQIESCMGISEIDLSNL